MAIGLRNRISRGGKKQHQDRKSIIASSDSLHERYDGSSLLFHTIQASVSGSLVN